MKALTIVFAVFLGLCGPAAGSWIKPSGLYAAAAENKAAKEKAQIQAIVDAQIDARVPGMVRDGVDLWVKDHADLIVFWLRALGYGSAVVGTAGTAWKIGGRRERTKTAKRTP